uniref:Putative secreted protein n=1 Tax=Anopheles darlingi TaxID=43151 RepID=A0A2M4DJS5_ANODA
MLLCFIHFLICFLLPIHSLSLCFIVSTSSYSYNGCFWHVLRHGLLLRRPPFFLLQFVLSMINHPNWGRGVCVFDCDSSVRILSILATPNPGSIPFRQKHRQSGDGGWVLQAPSTHARFRFNYDALPAGHGGHML